MADKRPPATGTVRNARYRKSMAAKEKAFIEELNDKRAQLNLPPITIKPSRPSLKGTKRPEYAPPTKMDEDEVKEWKYKDRLRRKAARERERRKERRALMESLEEQLAILTKAIEQKTRAEEVLSNVATAIPGVKECFNVLPKQMPAQSENLACATHDRNQKFLIEFGPNAMICEPLISVAKERVDQPTHVPAQSEHIPCTSPDQSISDREAQIELDANALICEPLIQSHEIENAILSEICTASLSDDISIPFLRVFDIDVVK